MNAHAKHSWRDVLKVHPAAELFPTMSPDELRALGEDIKKNGLVGGPILWRAAKGAPVVLLDGHIFDAMEVVGLPVLDAEGKWLRPDLDSKCLKMQCPDPYAYEIAAYIYRRRLTGD